MSDGVTAASDPWADPATPHRAGRPRTPGRRRPRRPPPAGRRPYGYAARRTATASRYGLPPPGAVAAAVRPPVGRARPARPGQVIAAAVLAFVQAGAGARRLAVRLVLRLGRRRRRQRRARRLRLRHGPARWPPRARCWPSSSCCRPSCWSPPGPGAQPAHAGRLAGCSWPRTPCRWCSPSTGRCGCSTLLGDLAGAERDGVARRVHAVLRRRARWSASGCSLAGPGRRWFDGTAAGLTAAARQTGGHVRRRLRPALDPAVAALLRRDPAGWSPPSSSSTTPARC